VLELLAQRRAVVRVGEAMRDQAGPPEWCRS
jgi:hypothetical protein